jgi:hypothetical protein
MYDLGRSYWQFWLRQVRDRRKCCGLWSVCGGGLVEDLTDSDDVECPGVEFLAEPM